MKTCMLMDEYIPKENEVYEDLWCGKCYIYNGTKWILEENANETQKAIFALWSKWN